MTTKNLSRRDFLKMAGLTIASVTVTCSGLGALATHTPEIQTPEVTYNKETPLTQRILVTYATRAGSTAEIATAIGEQLSQRGFGVDLKPVKASPALNGYQAVILGSPIRAGNWLPEMVDFVKANQAALAATQVALLTVHMQNTGDDEASRTARLAYLKDVRPLLPKAQEVYFEGAMNFSRLSMMDRFISKMVKASEADHRDWAKIRAWANDFLK